MAMWAGRLAIEDDIDRHALATQAGCHRHAKLGVVFDQQHPHRFSSSNPAPRLSDFSIANRRLQQGYSVTGPQPACLYNHTEENCRRAEGRAMHDRGRGGVHGSKRGLSLIAIGITLPSAARPALLVPLLKGLVLGLWAGLCAAGGP